MTVRSFPSIRHGDRKLPVLPNWRMTLLTARKKLKSWLTRAEQKPSTLFPVTTKIDWMRILDEERQASQASLSWNPKTSSLLLRLPSTATGQAYGSVTHYSFITVPESARIGLPTNEWMWELPQLPGTNTSRG